MTTTFLPHRIFLSDLLIFFAKENIFDHVIRVDETRNKSISTNIKNKNQFLSTIVDNYIDKIYRYIRHNFNLEKSTTDDIVQEIFFRLPEKLDKYDSSRDLEPRLFKVAHNFALDRIRKESGNDVKIESISKLEDFIYKLSSYEGEDLPENVEKTYKNGLLKIILYKLNERNRQLIILFFLENKTYEEIAQIIGVQTSGVGTLLSRAKKELKKLIETDPILLDALVYNLGE